MNAEQVARDIYQYLPFLNWETKPDGVEVLTTANGYVIGISNDAGDVMGSFDPVAQHDKDSDIDPVWGISWWVYEPGGDPVTSDGWEGGIASEIVDREIRRICDYVKNLNWHRECLVAWADTQERSDDDWSVVISDGYEDVDIEGRAIWSESFTNEVERFTTPDDGDDQHEDAFDSILRDNGYRRTESWNYYGDGIVAKVERI
jgi:hypothetical protein